MESTEIYDLLILVDATSSMYSYLAALRTSLPQIISISTLTDCFSRVGLLAYRDYCDTELLDWSGWFSPSSVSDEPAVDLILKVEKLYPMSGGDGPEATKTGLARAYELMRKEAKTIILLYTDAAPHTYANGSLTDRYSNLAHELAALKDASSYGGYGPNFRDWVSATLMLTGNHGDKECQAFSVLGPHMGLDSIGYYNYLSTMTGGACLQLHDSKPATISKVTVEALLAWMGVEKTGVSTTLELPAHLIRYTSVENIEKLVDEKDKAAKPFFLIPSSSYNPFIPSSRYKIDGDSNITKIWLSLDTLKKHLPKKTTPVQDFAKRYAEDPRYRIIAVEQLRKIIYGDVSAISLNPVFGSLWRVVCNDRDNEARDELTTAFGSQIDRIADANEKARMKVWLEESYDYTAEVLATINSVPLDQRFPCVCLDPTLSFTHTTEDGDTEQTEDKAITLFRRDELLEIGRSCDYKILRRLGRVLTRLTYINSADEVPAHIAAAPETEIPRIPISLARPEHKRRFWRILLHIVVPGTMLSGRPAALLAALSIRLGVQPLLQAAEQEMLLWRERWNDPKISETWNVSCLSLLMDADEAYRKRLEDQDASRQHDVKYATLLNTSDRSVFKLLVSYKMLQLNLDTTLTARVGWTPVKTKVALGPTAICKSCEYPRSVTIMGADGRCGICLWSEWATEEEREVATTKNVTKEDSESTLATWVECNVWSCRAQYVVYRPEELRVRPKCHYCRVSQEAPVVECRECLNRIIWPVTYRPNDIRDYTCHMCTSGHKSIIEEETTATQLSQENTTSWLLRDDEKLLELFNNRSLFHTITTCGPAFFHQKIELFPPAALQNLTLKGKPLHNVPSLILELESWVSGRRAQGGICTLCFTSYRKSDLMLACGRTGCLQKICRGCLEGWYGLNGPGRIINTAALACPFCRRAPTAKTLAKYGMGIHALGHLREAVEERGSWIYAWCGGCGCAKQYMARVCAAGAPAELRDWMCEPCAEKSGDKMREKMKECPGCGTMTEKIGGCNHIACTVRECETHWCFLCGGKFDQEMIYDHMQKDHGGYYGHGVAAEEHEDEEDEDEDEEAGWY
ncbi:hypothetical protein M430DRAFT_36658 [Amorphotheca resinae ATCC 22711]|jgi:hypothetical protein|uniref:RBR-type E3 ubiquitin transferase n=1 Tax=Amorphotheca resinae ATCC 22711 TaxID=857342 RepID=A0A2T3AV76_AMORE|nr:hypothetical protein M430DRAFT_36658 [Amorphotheca resinae ATCC 22711]PSS12568.1 hypothetical protein M430DRAFT_36658 [Amorphotheca resinae ATCC 22711]